MHAWHPTVQLRPLKKEQKSMGATATLGQLDMSLWVPFPLSLFWQVAHQLLTLLWKKGNLFLPELNPSCSNLVIHPTSYKQKRNLHTCQCVSVWPSPSWPLQSNNYTRFSLNWTLSIVILQHSILHIFKGTWAELHLYIRSTMLAEVHQRRRD
jgi:hypothetical protein